MPKLMRALQVRELTPDLSGVAIVELPRPVPMAGEVLVRIDAAALGFPDLLMTQGLYQAKPALPFVPGMEGAGTVVEAGEGSRWSPGDEVIFGGKTGGIAQYGCFAEGTLIARPGNLSIAQAAALRTAYITAWVALVRKGRAEAGEWLLVQGAAGGVGLAAVDLGLALGLRVIAVASSAAKRGAIAHACAAHHVIDGSDGFRDQVMAITGGRGADLVFDPVGGDVFDESTRCVAFDGRLLVVGFAAGRIAEVRTNIPLIKGFSIVGVRAGEYGRRFPDRGSQDLARLCAMAEAGAIHPNVGGVFGLDEWRKAFAAMEDRTVVGRSVILPHS